MKECLKCKCCFSSDEWPCPACGFEPIQLNGIVSHAASLANGGGGFKAEYFSNLADLEETNFWFRARNEIILWALYAYNPSASNFLEVGCGTGFVLSGINTAWPDIELNGSEIFLSGLSHARKRLPSANLMQMDARHIPFVDEFDVIGSFDVLEHIEEDEIALKQLQKALKPGGTLLLTVPQHPWLWSPADVHACHVRRYTRTEIESKVKNAGFDILRSTSFVTTLLPAMIISRTLQKKKQGNIDPSNELKISPILNRLFYNLIKIELKGIKLGMNYPVGGSRLVVAQKAM